VILRSKNIFSSLESFQKFHTAEITGYTVFHLEANMWQVSFRKQAG
jgi:hypothetical protein